MNLHKILAITLFAMCSQPLNAGITFSQEEIEAKNPNSLIIDRQTGEISIAFEHDKDTRQKMMQYNEEIHASLTFGSTFALLTAGTFSLVMLLPDLHPEIAHSNIPTITHTITALCAAAMTYNLIKGWLNKKAMIILQKKERVYCSKYC